MVAPLVPEFESHFVPCVPWLKHLPLYSVRGTLQYVAAPLLVPARGSSCWWLLDRVWAALISTHMYDIFSTYTLVLGSVSIHNLRNVAPRYGELLALLVYLTLRRSNGINQSRILHANEGQTHQEMLQVCHHLR